jgi:hypothetical protein
MAFVYPVNLRSPGYAICSAARRSASTRTTAPTGNRVVRNNSPSSWPKRQVEFHVHPQLPRTNAA